MKRRILLALLCMGMPFIGARVYAGLVQSDSTSMLSDREMASITGKCCYEEERIDCRVYGDIDCVLGVGLGCPIDGPLYHDPFRYLCDFSGPANDKKCSCGTVACFTPTNIVVIGLLANYICSTAPPPGYDPDDYFTYYLWCDMFPPASCMRCTWGSPAGPAVMKLDCDCSPI